MLCVSELSEALEEYRSGRPVEWYACEEVKSEKTHACNPKDEYDCTEYGNEAMCRYRGRKPEGIGTELADCIIRILDYCGHAGIDIDGIMARKMEYNKSRPYRHGGKVC